MIQCSPLLLIEEMTVTENIATLEAQDEYYLDTPDLRDFIAQVRQTLGDQPTIERGLDALQPRFAALLADQTWLPDEFAAANPMSGMGGGIGTWLLFRAGDRS